MNRKHIALAVSVLALMIVGIVALVRSLYTEKEPDRPEASSSAYAELLAAVPSDAALVFCLDGSRAAQRLAADSTGVLGAFISPGSPVELRAFLSHVAREKTVVSLHNSGALVPLVVASFPHADSASLAPVVALAASAGLKTACDGGLLLASRSETLVGTARRHLSDGYSILQSEGFSEALSSARDGNAVLVNGSYAAKIYQVFAAPARRSHASAAGNMARWLSFGIGQLSRKIREAFLFPQLVYTDPFHDRVQISGEGTVFIDVCPDGIESGESFLYGVFGGLGIMEEAAGIGFCSGTTACDHLFKRVRAAGLQQSYQFLLPGHPFHLPSSLILRMKSGKCYTLREIIFVKYSPPGPGRC